MRQSSRTALMLGLLAAVAGSGAAPPHEGHADARPPDAAGAKPLIVCAVPTALPRTGRAPDGTPEGLDAAVIARVGRSLGRAVEFHWCASAECGWRCLADGRCDVVIGQPHDSGPPRGVAWSVPYAEARFGLVVPVDTTGIGSLADLHGKRVGVVAGTVALSEKDHVVVRFPTREALLDGFRAAALDAAFLDADFAAWSLHGRPRHGLRLVEGYTPRERWNLALAVRARDAGLLVEMNRALARLGESGAIRTIYADHGIPFRPSFTGTARRESAPETWRRVLARGEIVISADPANLPYSAARDDRPGFDVELARALAERLGVKLRVEWLDTQRESAVGQLLDGRCDLVFGEAMDDDAVADDEGLAGKVLYSRPYYGTGYVLVRRKDGPRVGSLAELKGETSRRLGAEAGSVADYRVRQRGYLRQLFRNQLATLKALDDGQIDFAYLWANVGWTLHTSPDFKLGLVDGYVPEDRWNVAIAMRRGDDELKRHVDKALDSLIKDGTVAGALARYHVPHFDPFPEPGRHAEAGGVIRHAVADRGPEPRMERVQTSKQPYDGLARVRSAGELVVGLDQNNLPFSSANPAPAGLDFEIAGLLAAQLGVSLRVYWAYSAHDSYPSKLSSKHLCDVILGIMPDDRFAQRVLYTRPYHVASYRTVVRAGTGPPSAEEPVAVEDGVSVLGLKGRTVRTYPSTEAVLEAVATGRAPSGYVVSTRGPWLAHRDWPGKLAFLPAADRIGLGTKESLPAGVAGVERSEPPGATAGTSGGSLRSTPATLGRNAQRSSGPIDSFPLCAAVRKADRDLKDAIDRAWVELERAGKLTRAFDRWQIPHDPVADRDARTER